MEWVILGVLFPFSAFANDGVSFDNSLIKSSLVLLTLIVGLIITKLKLQSLRSVKPGEWLRVVDELRVSPHAKILILDVKGKNKIVGLSQAGFSSLGEVQE